MALLVLGDLRIDVMGFQADNDRDYVEARLFRGAEALRAEEDAVATISGSAARNDRLKNPVQSNVLGKLGDVFVGELCPWVARVFIEAVDGHEERQACCSKCVERDCLRVSEGLGIDAFSDRVGDQAFDGGEVLDLL